MAPTLTAAVQTTAADGTPTARVLLTLVWPGIQTALFERLDPDGVWRIVRGPDGDQIVCLDTCVAWDHEAPLDQAVTYRATSPQGSGAVNSNIYFESGISPWIGANGGTVASSGTQHHQGSLALRLTPDGTTLATNAQSEEIAVTVGATYNTAAWVQATAASSWGVGIAWYNSSHAFVSGSLVTTALAAGTWTYLTGSGVAPAGAAYGRLLVQASGTPAASNLIYVDEAVFVSPAPLTVTAATVTLNANPFFESTASPWTALGGTVARSTAQAHQGSASLLLTPDGLTVAPEARSENVAATAGSTYITQSWMFCAVARNVNLGTIWRNSSGSIVTSSQQTVSIAANTWTFVQVMATAPASTAQAQITANMGGMPPSSNLLYLDEAMLLSTVVNVPSGGQAWLSHPGHPRFAAARIVNDLARTYPGRAGMFWPIGSALPITVTDVRGGGQGTVTWQVATMAEYQQIRSMVADGGALLMRLPPSWGGDSWYIQVADIAEIMPTGIITDGMRRYQMTYTRVDQPAGATDGALGVTCDDVTRTYATCDALVAAKATCVALETSVA